MFNDTTIAERSNKDSKHPNLLMRKSLLILKAISGDWWGSRPAARA